VELDSLRQNITDHGCCCVFCYEALTSRKRRHTRMTAEEFIAKIKAGEIQTMTGARDGDNIVELVQPMTLDDVDGVTAEAFNQGVFDATKTSWEEARAELQRLISRLMGEERRS